MRRLLSLTLFALCLLVASSSALAQSIDELWSQYDEAVVQFQELMVEVDDADPLATGGNRTYRSAIESGQGLSSIIESILAADAEIGPDERTAAVDALLTTRQIVGSLMVEVGDCQEARVVLQSVLNHPLISERQIVEESAQRWLGEAETCIEEQEAMAQATDPEDPGTGDPGTVDDSGGSRVPAFVMLGVGGATLIGGLAWDLALGGTRSDFDTENGNCADSDPLTVCDPDEVNSLKDTLDGAKVPIALLYGVGLAATVGGVIWVIVSGGGGESDTGGSSARLEPWIGPDGFGLSLSGRF